MAAALSVVEFVAVHGLSFADLLADAAAAAVVAADVIWAVSSLSLAAGYSVHSSA